MSTYDYLKSLIRDKNVASVTPSSGYTVRKATRKIDFSRDLYIIEYGPGTGVFADHLLSHMTDNSRLIMIELNAAFADKLKENEDPRVSVHEASATEVEAIAGEYGITKADYILSGIPFSFLQDEEKHQILEASHRLLKPGGFFLAYQTSSHLKKPLEQHFSEVHTTYEFRNIPPMCIYEARKASSESG